MWVLRSKGQKKNGQEMGVWLHRHFSEKKSGVVAWRCGAMTLHQKTARIWEKTKGKTGEGGRRE